MGESVLMSYDVTFVGHPVDVKGFTAAHDPACPEVEKARTDGIPLATLLRCEHPLPDDVVLHDCFKGR